MNPRNDTSLTTLVSSIIEEGKATDRSIRCACDKDGVPELISVYDVIAVLCDCSLDEASDKYRKTVREKIPVCSTYKFPGERQRDTPVAIPSTIVRIISQLPRNKYPKVNNMRTKFAEVITRAIESEQLIDKLKTRVSELEQQLMPIALKDATLTLNGVPIVCRASDGYIDATELCRASMKTKLIADWYRLKRAKEFMTALSSDMGIPIAELVKIGAQHEHTWIHRKVAYELVMWLSISFAIQVNRWLDQLIVTGSVTIGYEQKIEEVEAQYKAQVKSLLDHNHVLEIENSELKDVAFLKHERMAIDSLTAQMSTIDLTFYKDASCLYSVYIGEFDDEPHFKYGYSNHIANRLKAHEDEFGDDTKLTCLFKCANGEMLETKVREYLQTINALREHTIDGDVVHREIFVSSKQHPIMSIVTKLMMIRDVGMTYDEKDLVNERLKAENARLTAENSTLKSEMESKGFLVQLKEYMTAWLPQVSSPRRGAGVHRQDGAR